MFSGVAEELWKYIHKYSVWIHKINYNVSFQYLPRVFSYLCILTTNNSIDGFFAVGNSTALMQNYTIYLEVQFDFQLYITIVINPNSIGGGGKIAYVYLKANLL